MRNLIGTCPGICPMSWYQRQVCCLLSWMARSWEPETKKIAVQNPSWWRNRDATSFRRMCEGSSKRVHCRGRLGHPVYILMSVASLRLLENLAVRDCQSIATRTWCVWNLEQPSIQHERYADNDTFSKLPYSSFLSDSCESVFDVDMKHGKILQKHMATVSESNVKKLFLPGQDWFACDLSAYLSRVPQHCATASALKPWRRIK